MTRFSTFVIAILLIAFTGCKKAEITTPEANSDILAVRSAAGGKSGPSANGQGTLTVGTEKRHFSFHANTDASGNVTGSGVLKYTAGGIHIKFDINCMTVVGNVATMSGVVDQSDVLAAGHPVWFRVEDNGEGAKAVEDRITLLTYFINGAPIPCTGPTAGPLNPIEGGNIQVKP